jgi:hypothetical protein
MKAFTSFAMRKVIISSFLFGVALSILLSAYWPNSYAAVPKPFEEDFIAFPGQTSIGVNIHTPNGKAIKELDAGWVRWSFHWSEIEKTKGIYDFTSSDSVIRDFRENGLKILILLDITERSPLYPNYHEDNTAYLTAICRFTEVLVERYKDEVAIWEIGNEPQLDPKFFYSQPEKYTLAALRIAKSIAIVDPQARIAALASAWMDKPFIRSCLRYGLLNDESINILSFHGYHRKTIMPESRLSEDVQWLRQQVAYYQPRKGVIVIDSERGYALQPPMSPKSVGNFRNIVYSETEQAAYLARHYLEENYLGIEISIWYKDMWGEQNTSLYEKGADSRIRPMGRVMQNLAEILSENPKEMSNQQYEITTISKAEDSKTGLKPIVRSFVVSPKEKNLPKKLVIALWTQVESFDGKILQARIQKGDYFEEVWRKVKQGDSVSLPMQVVVTNLKRSQIVKSNIVNIFSEKQNKKNSSLALQANRKRVITETLEVGPKPIILVFDLGNK